VPLAALFKKKRIEVVATAVGRPNAVAASAWP
jgi:hypothetical protein